MARHIWFDDQCITYDYDCWLKTYDIEPAEVREFTDTLAGVDGIVDATEWVGRPVYENRDGTFEFLFLPDGGWKNVIRRVNDLRTKYHGRSVKIKLDDDEDIYYAGRLSFGSVSNVKGSAQFKVTANLEPFSYRDISYSVTESCTKTWHNNGPRKVQLSATASGGTWKLTLAERDNYGKSIAWSTTKTISDGSTVTLDLYSFCFGYLIFEGTEGSLSVSYTEEYL